MPLLSAFGGLVSNPYFSAGFGLMGVGTGLAIMRVGGKHAITLAKRSALISLEIPSRDKSFPWFLDWLSSREGHKTQHISVETNFYQQDNGEINTKIRLVPSTGTHFFRYQDKWIRCERTREKNVVDMTSGNLWETVTLTTLGRNRKIFEDILEEAKHFALQKEEGHTVIYTTAGTDWRRFGFPRKKRPLSSVILEQGKAERLVNDAKEFLTNSKWYIDRGIPYRRGYLLFGMRVFVDLMFLTGPPGTGKSSFITALAGELRLNICVLNLHARGLTDEGLNLLLNVAPQRSIILLEDIDAALEKNPANALTFSGLLNALDGVAATEGGGRILFMTTNHLEKLHNALIRPGRIDVKEFLDLATGEQAKRMFLKFYPTETSMAQQFSEAVPNGTVSTAQIQGYLMGYKSDPLAAIQNVGSIKTAQQK